MNPCEPIEVASLPGDDLTIPFDVLGCNAEVLCEFSEIDPDFVDLNNGFLSVEAVLPGECATLIYETCVCDEKVIVAHLFIRDPVDPRFSAKCGQFVPAAAPVAAVVTPPFPDPCLVPIVSDDGVATNLYQLQDWATIYQVPEGQFSSAGVWTVPETGDYEVKAEIHLCSQLTQDLPIQSVGRGTITQQLPYFILVRYPSGSDPAVTPGSYRSLCTNRVEHWSDYFH